MKNNRFFLILISLTPAFAHEGAHTAGNEMPALNSNATIHVDANYRTIAGDALPNHHHGRFPNPTNPNRITPQDDSHRVSITPVISDQWHEVELAAFGIALNGILLEPNAAEWWQDDRNSGWRYEALGHHVDLGVDGNHAHVQPTGKYHYHGMPSGLIEKLDAAESFVLLGYAADGFPVYSHWSYSDPSEASSELRPLASSYRIKSGVRPSGPGGDYDGTFVEDYEYVPGLGDLDQANGRTGVTPEYPNGTYYYVITPDFPFIPRYWRGEPSRDFIRRGGGGGSRPQGPIGGADRRGGRGRPQNPTMEALADSEILSAIGLSKKNTNGLRNALRELQQSLQSNRRRSNELSAEERRVERQRQLQLTQASIAKIREQWLTPKQNLFLQQRINHAAGTESLLSEETRNALALTDRQFGTLYALIVQARAANALSFDWTDVPHYLSAEQITKLEGLIGTIN